MFYHLQKEICDCKEATIQLKTIIMRPSTCHLSNFNWHAGSFDGPSKTFCKYMIWSLVNQTSWDHSNKLNIKEFLFRKCQGKWLWTRKTSFCFTWVNTSPVEKTLEWIPTTRINNEIKYGQPNQIFDIHLRCKPCKPNLADWYLQKMTNSDS